MPAPLVECVPNFSEARRPEVVAAIQNAIQSTPDVRVLDRHSDLDHNRTVITFVGPPDAIEEAAFRGIAKAAELIDLNQHTGEHPRIGATDVVPFVPISGVSMEACIEIARRVGRRVGEELGIPVYLYEEAASRPERTNLEDIRRGQYEGLREEIATNPDRLPDFGPSRLGPAGATVIGARHFLIAYNVYLASDDVSIAKKIAKAIRHSSGGLRYLKALGLLVEGRAQVSMNFTNFQATPLARVVEVIRREAERYGVAVHHSELVGLIPQAALVDAAVWYLQLDQFEPDQVLEQRLYAGQEQPAQADRTGGFLEELASGEATPGGGSAAAYSGAAAAALVSMVARLTIGKKKYAAVEERMKSILDQSEALRAQLTEAIEKDAAAFEEVMAAFKLPKDAPEERADAVERATMHAAEVPLDVAEKVVATMELAAQVIAVGNQNAISDAATGAALARAALAGAGYNVRINLASLKDTARASQLQEQLFTLESRAASLDELIRSELQERGGISLA